jgi:hypothetical protein
MNQSCIGSGGGKPSVLPPECLLMGFDACRAAVRDTIAIAVKGQLFCPFQRASHRTQGVDPILSATGGSVTVRSQIFSQILFHLSRCAGFKGGIFAHAIVSLRGAAKISPNRLASSFHLRILPAATNGECERSKAT